MHPHDQARVFARRLIRAKALRYARLDAIRFGDQDDFIQELAMELERRLPAYDPARGAPEAFTTTVVDRCAQNYVRNLYRPKRHAPGVEPLEGRETIRSRRPVHARTGAKRLTDQEKADLEIDVAVAIEQLPEPLRELAEALKTLRMAEAARKLRKPRMTLYAGLAQIRRRFERAGLRKYL